MKKINFEDMTELDKRATVDSDGRVQFSEKMWAFLVQYSGTKAKTKEGIRKAVKKLVQEGIKRGMKGKSL